MREFGVDGKARRQHVARLLGRRPQRVEGRPGALGVHMVGRDRRDAAPVVDAGAQQGPQVVGEIRRCLDVHLGRQHQPGHADGPQEIVGRARGDAGHGGAGLGQEVLDDDLLDLAEARVRGGDGLEGGQLPGPVVTDADQDPGGEGDVQLPGRVQRGQPPGRLLVRRAPVRREVLGQRLDHHPLAGRHRPQRGQLVGEEGARIGVGEQAGLLEYEPASVGEVVDRGGEAVVVQPGPGQGIAQLGPLAQGEERLVAPRLPTGAGDGPHLVGSEIGRRQARRGLGEGAVAAAVTAEHGERDEDLGRIGDATPVGLVAHAPGQRHELDQWHLQEIGVGKHQGQSMCPGPLRWRRRGGRRRPGPGGRSTRRGRNGHRRSGEGLAQRRCGLT